MSSQDDEVGSVAEEAAKLLGALSDWSREHQPGDDTHERQHAATGARECDWCPVCRAVHLVRECSPEVRTHLADAAASLMQAAAGLVAAAARESSRDPGPDAAPDAGPNRGPGRTRPDRPGPDRVEHIDLDPDPDRDPDPGEERP